MFALASSILRAARIRNEEKALHVGTLATHAINLWSFVVVVVFESEKEKKKTRLVRYWVGLVGTVSGISSQDQTS